MSRKDLFGPVAREDTVHRDGDGLAVSVRQLCQEAERFERCTQLAFFHCVTSACGRCHLHSGYVFPPPLSLSGNTLTDRPEIDLLNSPSPVKLTMEINHHKACLSQFEEVGDKLGKANIEGKKARTIFKTVHLFESHFLDSILNTQTIRPRQRESLAAFMKPWLPQIKTDGVQSKWCGVGHATGENMQTCCDRMESGLQHGEAGWSIYIHGIGS